ncbi:phage tail protein [Klebsiella sp. KE9767]|uniref:phage tail-collar fiber domain-containing protein n=1 Tax=Klebsiella sp. KE9767 TaxID=3118151 RepID=UPI0037535884
MGLVSAKDTLVAYGSYPAIYLPAQPDSIIKEIILTVVLTLAHTASVQLVIDPILATLTQESGDKRYLRRSLNLSDLSDAEKARDNLELGDSATLDVATTAGTVAAGDDSRMTGALQKEQNLSDLSNPSEALKSLGLDREGAGYKAFVDAIFYVGIVISGEQSLATRFT